jgi:hypothetical protein
MAKTKSQTVVGLEKAGVKVEDDQLDIDPVSTDESLTFDDVLKLEAFMAERVKVMIMATTDANAPPYADLSVNGVKAVVRRNVPTTISRAHLEVLARMKETRVTQQVNDGQREIGMESLRGSTALCYPFQVVEDKNPKGNAWLQHILAEAA